MQPMMPRRSANLRRWQRRGTEEASSGNGEDEK